MSQIQTSNWSETAASNNAANPNGWPEGMPPSGVNDTAREDRSAIKIWFNNDHGLDGSNALLSSGGAAATRTLTFGTAPASLFTGLKVSFKANSDFDASSTMNVNSLGAKNIQKTTSTGLSNIVDGDILSGQHVELKYDGAADKWIMLTPIAPSGDGSAGGTVTQVATGSGLTGGPITVSGTISLDINGLTTDNSIDRSADYVPYYDAGEGANNKVLVSSLVAAASDTTAGVQENATQAEVEAASSTTLTMTPGRTQYHPGVAKAWVMITYSGGTPAVTLGHNVASITDTATGRGVVNFTTAFSNANYVGIGMSLGTTGSHNIVCEDSAGTKSTTAFPYRVFDTGGSAGDPAHLYLVFFGDQ
jgi:hypothetical protein